VPYSEVFKDHLANPRSVGEVVGADLVADQTNPVCGDRLRLTLRLLDGVITESKFLAYGCAPTLVCGSVLVDILNGMTIDQASQISRRQLIDVIGGLPARKTHAAALAIETLRAALESFDCES